MADFATVAELETFLGTSPLGTRGTAMLGHASNAIRLEVHQDLEVVTGRQESWAGAWDRQYIEVSQHPVTAVSSVTINAVAFTAFEWTRNGLIWKSDGSVWDEGPIIVTYDSGFAPTSDEMLGIKVITLECAGRAIGGNPQTFGLEVQELRGPTPAVFLTMEEKQQLAAFMGVGVG